MPAPPPAANAAANVAADSAEMYAIPAAFRRMENAHILFWLLKDTSWCLGWKTLGLVMVLPTVALAVVIAWRSRRYPSELAHNLAVVCWIVANSYWMTSEFFGFDETQVLPHVTGRQLALVPFGLGLGILLYYYLGQRPRRAGKAALE